MATSPRNETAPVADAGPRNVFADLRRHKAYAARVAQLLDARRQRQVERVVQTQRKHRIHQAR